MSSKKYNIKGVVVNNGIPLKGIKIESHDSNTTTNSRGEFSINGYYDSLFTLQVFGDGYSLKVITPFIDSDIKKNLGIITLQKIENSLRNDLAQINQISDKELTQLIKPKLTFDHIQQNKINNLLVVIQTSIMPLILTQISKFGVTNIKDIIDKNNPYKSTCPSDIEVLKNIIKKKNKLTKQLNNTYKSIDLIVKTLGVTDSLLTVLNTALNSLSLIPVPSPPSIPILAGKLDSQIKKYSFLSKSTLTTLGLVRASLTKTLKLLNLLDSLIYNCVKDNNIGDIGVINEQINQELRQLTAIEPAPFIDQFEGFIFSIETENTTNKLKRKRAIAKNKQNITLLKGEWSYSSINQILIDELIFYIKINNLKAE